MPSNVYKCQQPNGTIAYQRVPCDPEASTLQSPPRRNQPNPGSRDENASEATELTPYTGRSRVTDAALKRAYLGQAFSSLSAVRIRLIQYRQARGEWPESLETLGFEPARMSSRHIQSVRLAPGGRIISDLAEPFGEDKKIALTPNTIMDGTEIEWRCALNFPDTFVTRIKGLPCAARHIP